MKKMIYFAAFAIMMAMGNMNAFAKVNAKHNEFHMNDKGRVEVRYDAHHNVAGHHGHKMSKHELKMMEKRRRMEERRMMEERRRMEAHRRHHAHHNEVVVVNGNAAAGVAAGVVATVSLAALISALAN